MATATVLLSGIDMTEDEYRETLAHAKRFEFTNGVVTAKRGPYMTPTRHVVTAEEISAALPGVSPRKGRVGARHRRPSQPRPRSRLPAARLRVLGARTRVGDSILDPQGVRFTLSERARQEVLERLLRLNHERYASEVARGLHAKEQRGSASKRRGAPTDELFAP